MPEMDGMELLDEARRLCPGSLGISMTAYATVDHAVAALKAGAYDYISKPFTLEQIQTVVERAIEQRKVAIENRASREAIDEIPMLVSRSPAMKHLLESALDAAMSQGPVLLLGESGTGKNILARQIHQWSARRDHSFIEINCTTLSEHQLETELFGHIDGSFCDAAKERPGRLQAADGGTVFLDEIAGLSQRLQENFLRFVRSTPSNR